MTGKYLDAQPPDVRLTLFPQYSRYTNPASIAATRAYVELARAYRLSSEQVALAYLSSRPFICSTIIGATTLLEQLGNKGGGSS